MLIVDIQGNFSIKMPGKSAKENVVPNVSKIIAGIFFSKFGDIQTQKLRFLKFSVFLLTPTSLLKISREYFRWIIRREFFCPDVFINLLAQWVKS